ncbi:hypothetical protein HYPSUDRAFT_89611 [Hypholoma sublateritium FD-334 SS-4]|uniref:TERF2-interacting telomeric protein 1 Myb domain-containing protein n=1 Tax=Hypholoma sublateritium (strain FD-334 SS-4) TaxID=945553 RepID=A0A0D2PGB9_HYPSF|nr:hypothetical protein HYPSUDRAFT_89611 [Hypholoma sublateritium FD-334 SS-4]
MSRNAFSSREIQYLVMYIAKYNPVPAGRLGNNLYKSLVENDKRRPWARGHSWQSWREYYKKNQVEMDRKIRNHQKEEEKKARAAEEPTPTNHAKEESEESEAQKPRPKVSNTSQNRYAQAGSSGQNAVTKTTSRTETAQRVTGARVEAPRQRARVEPEGEEQGRGSNRLPELATGGEYKTNVLNRSKGEMDHVAKDKTPKELPVKTERHTPPGERAPVINTLVEVVDMSGDTESDNDLMRELFGSFKEDDTQEIDELQDSSQAHPPAPAKAAQSESKKRVVKESPVARPVEPSVQVLSQEPTPPKSGAEALPEAVVLNSPARPAPLRKPKPTRKLREPIDEDPFETPASTPSPPPRPQKLPGRRGTLPVLVDDGFRTTLKRPRRSSTTGNEDAPVWPPKRAKRDSHNEQAEAMDVDGSKSEKMKTVSLPTACIYPPVPRIPASIAPRPVQVNAVASSSTSRHPPLNYTNSKIIQHVREPVAVEAVLSNRVLPNQIRKSTSHNAPAVQHAAQSTNLAASPAAAISRTSSTFTPPIGALYDNDPFMGRASDKAKGKARAPTVLNNNPPPRIDLQKQLQRRLTATSASVSASRSGRSSLAPSTSSARRSREKESGHHSPAHWNMRTDDPKFRDAEFLEAARQATVRGLARIAAKRGLELEQVRSIFMAAGNLEDTDFVLEQLHARRLQGRASAAAGRTTLNDDGSVSSEEIPAGLVLRTATVLSAVERSRQSTHQHRVNKPRRSGRASLIIRPLPPADDEYDFSEYSPPDKSRAGQFARLERQGRLEEALERERRRVSGIHVEQTQLPLRQSSPALTVSDGSPSPKSRQEEEHMEVDASPHGSDDGHVEADEQDEVDGLDDVGVHEDVEEPEYVDVCEDVDDLNDIEVHEDASEQDDAHQQDDADRQDESDGQYNSDDEGEVAQQDGIEEHIAADELSDATALSDAEQYEAADVESVAQDEQDDDDIYMPERASNHEADDESEDRREDDGAPKSSPPYPTTRTLMKRLSGGRENDPAFIAEMREHRRLALSVTKENADEMRAFEAAHNPDLLKIWSIKWTRELLAIGRPGQYYSPR